MVVSVEPRGSLSKLFVSLPRSGVDDAVVDGEGLCCRAGVGGFSASDGPSINDWGCDIRGIPQVISIWNGKQANKWEPMQERKERH